MHELVSGQQAPKLTLESLTAFVRERIHTPIVEELYNGFVENGINQTLVEILGNIPEEYRPPILHTLSTHVTKEKPVFVYGIGSYQVDDKDRVRFIAASVDLLWCLSLIVDDIFDADAQRAGKETAWRIFGKEPSYRSAEVTFELLQCLTEKRLSTEAKDLLIECVTEGISSLEDPVIRTLDSSRESILDNIDRRARFHCEYPIRALFPEAKLNSGKRETVRRGTEGLFCVNRAGQILNDVKDLVPSQIYGRDTFSDISGGTSTIPLIMLYEDLDIREREGLRGVFGNPSATADKVDWLTRISEEKLPRQDIYSLVSENYRRFLETMEPIVDLNYFGFCQKWVDYKLDQALILLAN
jgi:geranylgeranyl pyrophosphate synthase